MHTSVGKLGQPMARPGSGFVTLSTSAPSKTNSSPHVILTAPGVVGGVALLGANEYARSCHVIMGMIVSTRGSTDAAANWISPPYEPPTMPTLGSPGASCRTWSRLPRKLTSWLAARPSQSGSSSVIRQPEPPKPRPE